MKTVIVDLDGICFDCTQRLERCKFCEKGGSYSINWEKAFSNEEVGQDKVIEGAPESVRKIAQQVEIMYLTGRSESCRKATYEMLKKYDFPVDEYSEHISGELVMRPFGDFAPDYEFKKAMILSEKSVYLDFVAAIDDDYNGTLKPMYESLDIPCFTSFDEFFRSEIYGNKSNNEKVNSSLVLS